MKNRILSALGYANKPRHVGRMNVSSGRTYPLSNDERVAMTCSCRDSDIIPKVVDAGRVIMLDGQRVQIMHDGTKVVAGGYYGNWTTRIIKDLRGHHEPQEELIFHHILRHVRPESLMVELGAFWAYYSNWYLGAIPGSSSVCVEPDENNLECGRRNLALNGREAELVMAAVGASYSPACSIRRESDQKSVDVPCHNMESLLQLIRHRPIELMHIDAQGAELPFLSSAHSAVDRGLLRFLIVSTHHESISGSPYTHEHCKREILSMGGTILTDHSVEESFSGDGLIAASFLRSDRGLCLPKISLNRAENSLFGSDAGCRPYEIAHARFGPMVVSRQDQVISKLLLEQQRFEEEKIFEVIGFLSEKFHFTPDKFVDIGANIGTHIVAAMNSGRFSTGIAIEMEEWNFTLLQANVALNRLTEKTRLIQAALSDKESVEMIELSQENFGDHRIRASRSAPGGKYNEQHRSTRSIRTTTLDRLLELERLCLGHDTLVWIDIQGHEGHALTGAKETFSAKADGIPYVVIEMWPYGLERTGGRDLFFGFLQNCCAIHDINAEGWTALPPLSPAEVMSLYEKSLACKDGEKYQTDLLCIIPTSNVISPT